MDEAVTVVGGGLAGSECAWQLARRGIPVTLYEMRPGRSTPAHRTSGFAELVCSNSLRSDDPEHPAGLLKREMEAFGSLVIAAARAAAVPAGGALALDRDRFSNLVTDALESHPLVTVRRDEVIALPGGRAVLATGPLTSEALAGEIRTLLGDEYLYFYDSVAPIVEAESLDMERLYWASRYGKGGGKDYLNAPLDEEEYRAFHRALVEAETVPLHDFEETLFFEGCLPVEEMARRGLDTLRFGPLKPVGLETPTGELAHAVVQLRQEDLDRTQLNLVGFQSRLKWGEQERVFRMIPGLENAEFVRLGQVHRNTFVSSPTHLDRRYRVRRRPELRLAGQITGVEGYLESAATGLVIGLYLAAEVRGARVAELPYTTALGALARHVTESDPEHFQPANVNFGMFEPIEGRMRRRERRAAIIARAREHLPRWAEASHVPLESTPVGELPAPAAPAPVEA